MSVRASVAAFNASRLLRDVAVGLLIFRGDPSSRQGVNHRCSSGMRRVEASPPLARQKSSTVLFPPRSRNHPGRLVELLEIISRYIIQRKVAGLYQRRDALAREPSSLLRLDACTREKKREKEREREREREY